MKWNPYFLAYARAAGREPDAQLEHDKARYPGGCMAGFIVWIAAAKRRFAHAHPDCILPNGDYRRLNNTEAFLGELSSVMGIPITDLVVSIQGGVPELQGTWVHPDIAKHNYDVRQAWNQAFVQTFRVSLLKFWHPLYGFDLVRFDTWLGTPHNVSTKDYLHQRYGEKGVAIIAGLIELPADKKD